MVMFIFLNMTLMEFFGNQWSNYLLIIGGLWEMTFAVRLIARVERSSK